VIGSGAGLDVAAGLAQQGQKVAVIEKGRLGGTCLNRGCIPSKMLIHSADVVDTIKSAHLFGIKVTGYDVDFSSIVERVSRSVDHDSDEIEESLKNSDNPRLYQTECKFVGKKILQVGEETIKADKILLASGGRPMIPDIDGLDGSGFITSDEALRSKKQPKTMTILGGGYVAVEMAHFYGSLGTRINIVHRNEFLLNREDEDIARKFTEVFSKKYNIFTNSEPTKVSKKAGEFQVTIKNNRKGGQTEVVRSDQLLVAVGRVPNSDTLDLEETGVKTDAKGFVLTDEYLETNVKGIYALGDAVGHFLFRHSANLEAEYDFNNIMDPENRVPMDYTAMPHAIFSSPQVAGVGKTEQQLREARVDFRVGRYDYINTAMGEAIEERVGFVKFLVEKKTRKILGCHILGSDAATLIHEAIVAMKSGDGGIGNILHAVHVHPALSEVVQRAAGSLQ
jgi:dihydrolipoamide dehydrogenase